jgi:hypothetical protein
MARRYGATAAVNGGYFVVAGRYMGASNGVYQLAGDVISSGTHRSALLLCAEERNRERTALGVVNFTGRALARGGHGLALAGINRQPLPNELVIFTPSFGPRTLTAQGTKEAVLDAQSRVVKLTANDSPIPANGSVLSGAGYAAEWLERHAAW